MLAWSVLVIPMVLIARYYKKSLPTWFSLHWMVNVLALLLISVAFILVLIAKGTVVATPHSIIGVLVFILSLLQGILGQVANKMWYEGKVPGLFPDKLHWYLGRLVVALAITNTYLGIDLFGGNIVSYILFSCFIVLTLVFAVFLECRVGQTVSLFCSCFSVFFLISRSWLDRFLTPLLILILRVLSRESMNP